MDVGDIDTVTIGMMTEAFLETAEEAVGGGQSKLNAIREGIVAASMVLSANSGIPDDQARDLARKWANGNDSLEFD